MDTIAVSWRKYGASGEHGVQVDIDTIQGTASAWTSKFNGVPDVLEWLRAIVSPDAATIAEQTTQISNFGEGRVEIPCTEKDFSQYGFVNERPSAPPTSA